MSIEVMKQALETLDVLWGIIDDIDTIGDISRSDDKAYRSLVERKQRTRFAKTGITTDGYTLEGGSITALRQAIKQAGKQKPVAWLHRMDNTEGIKSNGKGVVVIDEYRPHPFGLVGVDFDESYPITSTPLYTSAQQQKPWVGLTPEDYDSMRPRVPYIVNDFSFADVAAIVEAKLKEKNA